MNLITEKALGYDQQVLMLGTVYGGPSFWYEVIATDPYPDNLWRALLCIGCYQVTGPEQIIRSKLHHPDSRVRAWSCFALCQLGDEIAADEISRLASDPSLRVRYHASRAIGSIVSPRESEKLFPYQRQPQDCLILVSDDSQSVQTQISQILEPEGYPLVFASDMRETLEKAEALKPMAILTDNQKNGDNSNGLRMTTMLSSRSETRETAIFMLTADWIPGPFLWHGGDCFIFKQPNCRNLIIEAVKKHLLR
jgi:CheY-like chemotaxis protein